MQKTAHEVSTEFINADFGQPIVYYEGFLMKDAERHIGYRIEQNEPLIRLREHVWRMYEEGRVCLTQRKLSEAVTRMVEIKQRPSVVIAPETKSGYREEVVTEAVYQYIMTKRERKRGARAS